MELDFVAWLAHRMKETNAAASSRLSVSIGDDAAVLNWRQSDLVITTDVLIDGVHFLSKEHDPIRIGYKALAVNLSDLAAMAAKPVGAVVGLVLPRNGANSKNPEELAKQLTEGMLPLVERFSCPLVGGDTNLSDGPLTIAVTAFGEPNEAGVLTRGGANPGDVIAVTGSLGGSILAKHLDFVPRVEEATQLHQTGQITSMMDLTDGLAMDLNRLCKASQVGAVIDQAALPLSCAGLELAKQTRKPAWEHALSDGEDFELLFTVAKDSWPSVCAEIDFELTRVGEITKEATLLLRTERGELTPLERMGYEHR